MRHIPDEELHAYLDQALSRSQCVEIESHLAECPGCSVLRDDTAGAQGSHHRPARPSGSRTDRSAELRRIARPLRGGTPVASPVDGAGRLGRQPDPGRRPRLERESACPLRKCARLATEAPIAVGARRDPTPSRPIPVPPPLPASRPVKQQPTRPEAGRGTPRADLGSSAGGSFSGRRTNRPEVMVASYAPAPEGTGPGFTGSVLGREPARGERRQPAGLLAQCGRRWAGAAPLPASCLACRDCR